MKNIEISKNINLNLYSYGFTLNFLNIDIKKKNIFDLINEHNHLNLSGVELPADTLFVKSVYFENFLIKYKNKFNFFICIDNIDNLNFELLETFLRNNIKYIRVRMPQANKTIYGGNKHLMNNFDENIENFKKILSFYKSFFLSNNIFFCIENHQDLHSDDILNIINELGSDYIGINWDIGNSISCCELPDSFYDKCKDFIKNIHLKDYIIVDNESYISLVRCKFGEGFLKNFDIRKYLSLEVSRSLELGAQISRKCYIYDEKYWQSNKMTKNKNSFIDHIKSMSTKNIIKSDYENKLPYDDIIRNERKDFDKSFENLMKIIN